MFDLAHQSLVDMDKYSRGYASVARNSIKFCHGFGIFQVDLQFFPQDPDFFLQKQWADFSVCLRRCLAELHSAVGRAGLDGRTTLSDLEQVNVAIAYNAGTFNPSRGLKQGHFNGSQYYGESIFDLIRLAQTAATASIAATIAPTNPGVAAVAAPAAVKSAGTTMKVDAAAAPLLVRGTSSVKASAPVNVVAALPGGHLVKVEAGKPLARVVAVETSLHGALVRGFVQAKALVAAEGNPAIPLAVPSATAPTAGIVAVDAPRRAGLITRRKDPADAHSLNEAGQPGRAGTTAAELRDELAAIITYLDVANPQYLRYKPRTGVTFCNIYAHDLCYLAGIYLPRVWWTQDAIERLTQGQTVEPSLGATIDEQRANDLFRWLRAFGLRFGWRQASSLTELQTEVNTGAVGLIVARRKENGRPGHIVAVVPETATQLAKRDAAGAVTAPLQSQAGSSNFSYGTGRLNWWLGSEFAESAFWIHA